MFMQDATRFALDAATPIAGLAPLTGLTAGTLVETATGWTQAEALRIGMGVYTLEGGQRPVLALDRAILPVGTTLVRLPGGSFDNCSTLDLMPDQVVMVDEGDGTLSSVAARRLVGRHGVTIVRMDRAGECVTPLFAEDEVIWTNSGTRLFCTGIASSASCAAKHTIPYFPAPFRRVSN